MGWVPEPGVVWIAPALVASLFGFANTGAKDEGGGFFLGFPSYWNVVAFSVLPVRFLYPNLTPRPWKGLVILGGVVWLGVMLALLPGYPGAPAWAVWLSLVYPASYVGLSLYLGRSG
jgi:phosphatidylcholine synthase